MSNVLVVSKNLITNIDPRLPNPVVLSSTGDVVSKVWVFHRLEHLNPDFWQPLSREEIRQRTGIDIVDFDYIVVYMENQEIMRLVRKPATFPIEEGVLRTLPAEKMIYFTPEPREQSYAFIAELGHHKAILRHVEPGGSDTLGEMIESILRDSVVRFTDKHP